MKNLSKKNIEHKKGKTNKEVDKRDNRDKKKKDKTVEEKKGTEINRRNG